MAYKWTDNAIATATSVAGEDLLLFVDDPSGTPVSKKITVANLQSSLSITESQISDFGTYLPASSVSAFGLTLIDDANAAAARTTIGVDPAGTDNSTNVTLAGVYDYLTISGQEITLGQVDYNTDIANLPTIPSAPAVEISAGLPVFATGITAAEMRTLIGVDAAGTDNSTDVTLAGAYDYLTLIGQQITLGQVDLSTDVTGTLPSGNIGSHTHVASDITDFSEAVDDRSASLLTAGTDISITYNDVAGTLTVAYTGTSGATSLDGLTDVSAPTPTTGDLIRWSGTAWVNYADSNYAAASHTHAASDVTSGTFADARISQSSVTQHQAALSITESQISDLGTYQPLDAGLTSIAGLTTAADRMIYTTALDTYAVATLTAFGRSLLDDADAATARATLGVDAAGTDNSTDVTLAGSYDYLTLAGQAITLGQVDLATDVTGLLPHENGGLEADVSLYSGLLKISGGVTSSVADNSTNWDAAYTHSQVATGNPHSVTASDVGLGSVENTALSTWAGSANITTVAQSAVTQHQAALSITESQISDLGNYVDAGTALVYSIIF